MKDDIGQLEGDLGRSLSIKSVTALEGFPCATYPEFVDAVKTGRVQVLTAFNSAVVPCLGSPGERVMYLALTWSPALVSLALVAAAVVTGAFSLLWGIPLALLGFLLSTPAFMNSIGSGLSVASAVAVAIAWYRGNGTTAALIGSYLAANYLTSVARTQCDMIIREAILQSEPVLIWLYLQRSVVLAPMAPTASVGR